MTNGTKVGIAVGGAAALGLGYLYVKSRQSIPTDVAKKGGTSLTKAACIAAAASSGIVGPPADLMCEGATGVLGVLGKGVGKGAAVVGKGIGKGAVAGAKGVAKGAKTVGKSVAHFFGFGDLGDLAGPPGSRARAARRAGARRLAARMASPVVFASPFAPEGAFACDDGPCCESAYTDSAFVKMLRAA